MPDTRGVSTRGKRIPVAKNDDLQAMLAPVDTTRYPSSTVRGRRFTEVTKGIYQMPKDVVETVARGGGRKALKGTGEVAAQRVWSGALKSEPRAGARVMKADQTTAYQRHVWDGRFGLPGQQKGKAERKEVRRAGFKGMAAGAVPGAAVGAAAAHAARHKGFMYENALGMNMHGHHVPAEVVSRLHGKVVRGGAAVGGLLGAAVGQGIMQQRKRTQIQRRWDAQAVGKADSYLDNVRSHRDIEAKRQRRLGVEVGTGATVGAGLAYNGARDIHRETKAVRHWKLNTDPEGQAEPGRKVPARLRVSGQRESGHLIHDFKQAGHIVVPKKAGGKLAAGAGLLGASYGVARWGGSRANRKYS